MLCVCIPGEAFSVWISNGFNVEKNENKEFLKADTDVVE